jgi:hypothetical protein
MHAIQTHLKNLSQKAEEVDAAYKRLKDEFLHILSFRKKLKEESSQTLLGKKQKVAYTAQRCIGDTLMPEGRASL